MRQYLKVENSSFNCHKCGKSHKLTAYVAAHHQDLLTHTCDAKDCGQQHKVQRGLVWVNVR